MAVNNESLENRETVVGIMIRNKKGEFLLVSKIVDGVRYWFFPGGKLKGSETILQALNRELLEELGIYLPEPPEEFHQGIHSGIGWHKFYFITYTCNEEDFVNFPKLNKDDSIDDFAWINPNDLMKLRITPHVQFMFYKI